MSARPRRIRRADLERDPKLRVAFATFRIALYGFLGLGSEVCFYTLVRVGRRIPVIEYLFQFDWRVDPQLNLSNVWNAPLVALFGQCSLWMFLVYTGASFGLIEPIYRHAFRLPFWLRAVFYGLAILAFEALSGLALKALTGYAIWYYDDRGAILGMTSLFILPVWTATGLLVEAIYRELMDPKVRAALESKLPS